MENEGTSNCTSVSTESSEDISKSFDSLVYSHNRKNTSSHVSKQRVSESHGEIRRSPHKRYTTQSDDSQLSQKSCASSESRARKNVTCHRKFVTTK